MVQERTAQVALLILSESTVLALAVSALKANECTPEVQGKIFDSLTGMAKRLESASDALHMLAHISETSYPDVIDWAKGVQGADAQGHTAGPEELAVSAAVLAAVSKAGH